MSMQDIQIALNVAVAETLTGMPIEWENVPSSPGSGRHAQVNFLPNIPVVGSLGAEGSDVATGILQVTLRYPKGKGDTATREDFETLRQRFVAGRSLIHGDQRVTIVSCGRSQGFISDVWYTIYVSINWYAEIRR